MRLAPVLLYGALFWLAAIVAAPFLVASHSPAAVVAGVTIYRAASVVCHQMGQRSFHLSGFPVAVCARCFGLYLGAAAAALIAGSRIPAAGSSVRRSPGPAAGPVSSARGPDKGGLRSGQPGPGTVLAIAALPMALTWAVEHGGLWAGTNVVRFAGALPLGFVAASIVLAALHAETADRGSPNLG